MRRPSKTTSFVVSGHTAKSLIRLTNKKANKVNDDDNAVVQVLLKHIKHTSFYDPCFMIIKF